jgi:hypothetical protein
MVQLDPTLNRTQVPQVQVPGRAAALDTLAWGSVRTGVVPGRGSEAATHHRYRKDPVKLRRAIVVLMFAQGQSVDEIVGLLRCDEG